MKEKSYTEENASIIDKWVQSGWEWGRPVSHETLMEVRKGKWDVLLTPSKPVPHDWFDTLQGKKVLGLASGGGQQMPVFSVLGADCTVFDYSIEQLENERMVAEREGYEIQIVRGDMSKPLPFADESFDLIFHPVSNCYVEDVFSIWKECYRVLKKGGRLLAGLDNGFNYLFDEDETAIVNALPFNPLNDPKLYEKSIRNDWGIQFSHTIEEQIGGQLKAGLTLMDIYEDTNGEGRLHELGVPTFYATLSIKR